MLKVKTDDALMIHTYESTNNGVSINPTDVWGYNVTFCLRAATNRPFVRFWMYSSLIYKIVSVLKIGWYDRPEPVDERWSYFGR